MSRRRSMTGQIRRDAVLACLHAGAIWRGMNIAGECGITYSQAMVACRQLDEEGLIERITGEALGRFLDLSDGRRIWVGPECGAVGWRIRCTNDDLAMLEQMWTNSARVEG